MRSNLRERTRTQRWYGEAKATKRRGMEGEESESADSTEEAGEPASRDPVEGSGRPDYDAS
jgi:hypothetical protein